MTNAAAFVAAAGLLRAALRPAPPLLAARPFLRGPLPHRASRLARPARSATAMTAAAAEAAAAPATILLSDYRRPAFLVDAVDLRFQLDDAGVKTAVRAALKVRRAGPGVEEDLVLDGEQLELVSVAVDGAALDGESYAVDAARMTIKADALPKGEGVFVVESEVLIRPAENKALEGLYMSSGNFCTQCEAEGFRRITYFPDRPDVMSKYTVRVEGDKKLFPVLLSNGNMVETGDVDGGRHYAVYEDPWPKPAYLFALVAGEFAHLEDTFKTMSGKTVVLRIYVKGEAEVDKCRHAMASLQKAMKWDEEVYGLEYDLGIFNVVAVSDFSMGAMENKSLNVFNTTCVLASRETSTDGEFNRVEGVVAHEYFHNYSGNRVTLCRWFELTLKEGLTVFRDQSFSADMNSAALKRIQDVVSLRAGQFPEDAGPLAHPIRPTSCITPSTFYTATVYSKGAEIIRMLNTLAGPDGYRRGTNLYFSRHDGQAVTCEDFMNCIQETNPSVDLSTFDRWYAQSGSPTVTVATAHDAAASTLTLTVNQVVPKNSNQPDPLPMLIPMRVGLVGKDGAPVMMDDGSGDAPEESKVLVLKEAQHTFVLKNVPEGTLPSLFRGFSAPVIVVREGGVSQEELAFLMANDSDTFNSWESGQTLALQILLDMINGDADVAAFPDLPKPVIEAFGKALTNTSVDPSLRSMMFQLPLESIIISSVEVADPVRIRAARNHMRLQLAKNLKAEFMATLEETSDDAAGEYKLDPTSQGRRSLRGACLSFLATLEEKETFTRLLDQVRTGSNMTDVLSALSTLSCYKTEERETALAEFYEKWQSEPQTMLKWFRIQSSSPLEGVLGKVKGLMSHKAFDITNPNNVYALFGGFAGSNMHYVGSAGYEFMADAILKIDKLNPQVAARVARSLNRWRKYDADRQAAMRVQLDRILDSKPSKDLYEVIKSCSDAK